MIKQKVNKHLKYYLALSVSLVTFAVYLFSLRNDFLDWDDDLNVVNNLHIRSFDADFFKWAFFNISGVDYWRPLSHISHAMDYAIWGLDPLGHHLTNNVLHAINTFLVVLLVVKLLASWQAGKLTSSQDSSARGGHFILLAAGVTGLLFGLHPINVESVAWVSERKNLLYAFFYLAGLLTYLSYADAITPSSPAYLKTGWRSRGRYCLTLLFFTLALMSKPMAVTFPVVLLILDWHPLERYQSFSKFRFVLIEKVPFIVLSLFSSVLTTLAQKSVNAVATLEELPFSVRILVAVKSLVAYLWKILMPWELLPLYPYPNPGDVAFLSAEYFFPTVLVIVVTVICILVAKSQRLWFAVWCFYVLSLMPVLGIVQVGSQAMADRYAYLPSIGTFLLAGLAVAWVLTVAYGLGKRQALTINVLCTAILFLVLVAMSYLTIKQIGIWRNNIDLWTYVIERAPSSGTLAYYKRGKAYDAIGQFEKALTDYNKVIAVEPFRADAYYTRGILFDKMGNFIAAIQDYSQAITLNQYGASSDIGRERYFLFRGVTYMKLNQYEPAVADLKRACDLGNREGCKIFQTLTRQ